MKWLAQLVAAAVLTTPLAAEIRAFERDYRRRRRL
jgi:hypothetical protein